jgi:Sec-independent protein secretion pathway component TatC
MKAILYILLICLLESTIFCRKVITRQDQEEDHEKEKP